MIDTYAPSQTLRSAASERLSSRIVGLDVLRFAAALMVVLFHYGRFKGADPALPELAHFGWVGVQIFFVLSGFVVAWSAQYATPFSFFTSRVTRLVPGVWICAPISLAAAQLLNSSATDLHLDQFLNSVLFSPNGPWIEGAYWTLSIEIVFYAVVMCLVMGGRFRWIRPAALILGSISALFWLVWAATERGIGIPSAEWLATFKYSRLFVLTLVDHGVFFAIGILLWLHLVETRKAGDIGWLLLFIGAGCIQIANQASQYNEIYTTDHSWIVACGWWIASLAAIVVSVLLNNAVQRLPALALSAAGALALVVYPLYLINQVVGTLVFRFLLKYNVSAWAATWLTLLAVVSAAWTVAVLLERPAQHWMRSGLRRIYQFCGAYRSAAQ